MLQAFHREMSDQLSKTLIGVAAMECDECVFNKNRLKREWEERNCKVNMNKSFENLYY